MRWVWAWSPFVSVDLTVCFPITWLGNGWEPALPAVRAWVAYLNPAFELNPQTPKRCHVDLWSAPMVLIHPHPHQLRHPYLLQQQLLEPRVSVISFQPWCFFFGGLPFALLVLQCRAAFSSLSFSKYVSRVALLFGPMAPCPAASAAAHLSLQPDSPLALSFETLGLRWALLYQTSLPRQIISRTIWSEWTRSRWSPWLAAGCPLST